MTFQIQIASEIIRNPNISHDTFYAYAKLLQHYYVHKGKDSKLKLDHRKFMYFSNIKSNPTMKKILKQLFQNKLILYEVKDLPRYGELEVELNPLYLVKDKKFYFAQLPHYFLDQCILNGIGYEGFRLMYYFKSFINKHDDKCFCSRETIAEDIGSSPNSVDKYTKQLKKLKLINIKKHSLKDTGEYYDNEFGEETRRVTKFNNHYTLRFEQFEEAHRRMKNG